MGQWETQAQVLGKCPCGRGEVICDVETGDSAYSRAYFSHRMSCDSCSQLYKFSGNRNDHSGSFTLYSEEAEESRLVVIASDLAKPIHARLVPQVQRAISNQGSTTVKWHPLAIVLLGASDNLEAFRKDVRSYGNISSWVSNRITPDRFYKLVTTLGDTELLPLVETYQQAKNKAKAYVVKRIQMVALP